MKDFIMYTIVACILLFVLIITYTQYTDCQKEGGVLLRGMFTYECVKGLK